MSTEPAHDLKAARSMYSNRTLDREFPAIKDYLFPGARVLDVGCGPGTITIGVAQTVAPGTVSGVDIAEASIEDARRHAAERSVTNVSFRTAAAYELPFPDDEFDIAYAHYVIGWLYDPVRALREMKRVTRPGGMVIHLEGYAGSRIIYPPCPSYDRVVDAWRTWADRNGNFHVDHWSGARAVDRSVEAGLTVQDVRGVVKDKNRLFPGVEGTPPTGLKFDYKGEEAPVVADWYREIFDTGEIGPETVEAALREVDAWARHPGRLFLATEVMVIARVP